MELSAFEIALALFVPASGGLIYAARSDRALYAKLAFPACCAGVALSIVTLWQMFIVSSVAHAISPLIRPDKAQQVGKILSEWLVPDGVGRLVIAFDLVLLVSLIVAKHYGDKRRRGE